VCVRVCVRVRACVCRRVTVCRLFVIFPSFLCLSWRRGTGREKPSERGGVVASERERKRARERRRKGEEERDTKIGVYGGWEGRESKRSRER